MNQSLFISLSSSSKASFLQKVVNKNPEMSFVVTSPVGLVSLEYLGSYQARTLILFREKENTIRLSTLGFSMKDLFDSVFEPM